jgi:hypothetical protein
MAVESWPSLSITILKNALNPDGDAVKNGVLLSTEELHTCSYFVHSPSDTILLLTKTKTKHNDHDDSDDKNTQIQQSYTIHTLLGQVCYHFLAFVLSN